MRTLIVHGEDGKVRGYSLHVASVCGRHLDRQNRIQLEGKPGYPADNVGAFFEGALATALEVEMTGYAP